MDRPSTAPPTDNHSRSHSRLAASIKSFLSRSTLPSPSRFSLNSSFSYSESDPSSFHPPTAPKWPIRSNLDISTSPTAPMDAHRRHPSEAMVKIYTARSRPPMSQDSLALSAQNIRERDSKTRNVLRRRPSGSAKHFRRRGDPFPDVPLTPAGAVAEAYKQQELCRGDSPRLSNDSMRPRTSHGSGYDRDHSVRSPTPHYTPFRSSAERRMQPASGGRMRDADPLARGTLRAMLTHHPSASDASSPTLTHRVSTRWRKIKGGVAPEESFAARPSLQDVAGRTGRSMDVVFQGPCSSPIEPPSRPTSGPKLWRLMRRISTGGLRDQLQSENAVPPVPAIPKELLDKTNQAERSNEPVSTLHHQPSSPRDKDPTSPAPQITSSSSNSSDIASIRFFHKTHSARSSVTSYGEAMGHSNEIPLDRHIIAPIEQLRLGDSHTEGDKPAPVPRSPRRSASVPVALRELEDDEDEHAPLPYPRRQTASGSPSPARSRPPSTSSPASTLSSRFSSLLGRQSQTADGLVSLSPPPRPPRNARRGGSTASSPPHSVLVKKVGARQLDRTQSAQSDATARASPEPRTSCDEDARSHYTYRPLGAPRRPPLSEREKVDIWNDLLDRSDRAGGTLHIAGTEELMSDTLRFSMHSEV